MVLLVSIFGCYIVVILLEICATCKIALVAISAAAGRLLKPAWAVIREPLGAAEAPFALLGLTGAAELRGAAPGANQVAATHAHLSWSPHAHVHLPWPLA